MLGELRYALRQMLRRPGWTALAVGVLALAIGSSAAVFAIVDGVLFRPVAAQEPERLVRLFAADEHNEWISNSSYPQFLDYRDGARSFSSIAAWSVWNTLHVSLEGAPPRRTHGALATGQFFPLLGVAPQLGRLFGPADDVTPGAHPVAVVSDGFFRSFLGGDPAAIGRELSVNGQRFSVIGVLPRGFRGPDATANPDMWLPISMWREASPQFANEDMLGNRGFSWLDVVARLAPGVSLEQASAELDALAVARRATIKYADDTQEPLVRLIPANAAAVDPYRTEGSHRKAWLLLASVFAVLVIACLDVMGLLLVRREERRAELAVRLGIGAEPWRLVRQLLLEGLLLAVVGAAAGVLLAHVLLNAAVALAPVSFAIPLDLAQGVLSTRVLGAVIAVTVLSCVLAALVPALGVRRLDVSAAMRTQSQSVVGARLRPGAALLAGQIAASFVMLCLATLLLRSFIGEASVRPGFDPANVVVASVDRALQGYDQARGRAFELQVLEALRADPGVESAAQALTVPIWPDGMRSSVAAEGSDLRPEDMPHADVSPVSPGYFATMHIPIVAGRDFDARDHAAAPAVAIVSQSLADQLFPGGKALGARLMVGNKAHEIVGIAAGVALRSLREPNAVAFYRPTAQQYLSSTTFVARLKPGVSGDPVDVLRRAVATADPTLPLHAARTLEAQIGRTLGEIRLVTAALGAFAVIAVLLSLAGIYGLFAYFVRCRQREIGLRLALGANARAILALVMGQGTRVVVAGLLLGVAGALVATRALGTMLFGIGTHDPGSFLAAGMLLGLVALAAVFIPARQAARIDPQRSLRAE